MDSLQLNKLSRGDFTKDAAIGFVNLEKALETTKRNSICSIEVDVGWRGRG